jgi:hypothetical protein
MAQDQPTPAPGGATSTAAGTSSAHGNSSAQGNSNDNAASLYERISQDPDLTQALFRQALQNPSGTLEQICRLGDGWGLPVSVEQVKAHIRSLDDAGSKQWLLKARGGL